MVLKLRKKVKPCKIHAFLTYDDYQTCDMFGYYY